MDQFLAKANIEHFKKLLASETDAHNASSWKIFSRKKHQNLLPRSGV